MIEYDRGKSLPMLVVVVVVLVLVEMWRKC